MLLMTCWPSIALGFIALGGWLVTVLWLRKANMVGRDLIEALHAQARQLVIYELRGRVTALDPQSPTLTLLNELDGDVSGDAADTL